MIRKKWAFFRDTPKSILKSTIIQPFSLRRTLCNSQKHTKRPRESHENVDSRISQAADNVQSTFFVILRHEFKLEINILFYHPHTNGSTWRSSDRTASVLEILSRSPSNGDLRFVRVWMFTNNRLRFTSSGRRCLAVVVVPRSAVKELSLALKSFGDANLRSSDSKTHNQVNESSTDSELSCAIAIKSNPWLFLHFFTTEWKTFFHLACISFLHNISFRKIPALDRE